MFVEFTTVSERNASRFPSFSGSLLLDGGLGTSLAAAGVALDGPLWTARAIAEAPEALVAAHRAFFDAGADIATTATYQTVEPSRVQAAVACARVAACGVPGRFVAGSIGPCGAMRADRSEYTGAYAEPAGGWAAFHAPRIAALASAGVDLLIAETLPRFDEIRVLVSLMAEAGPPAIVSVTLIDPEHLPDGTPLTEVAQFLDTHPAARAIGINCCPLARAVAAHASIRDTISKPWALAPQGPLDAASLNATGAAILGGCCGTTPADIASLRRLLHAAPRGSAAG